METAINDNPRTQLYDTFHTVHIQTATFFNNKALFIAASSDQLQTIILGKCTQLFYLNHFSMFSLFLLPINYAPG